MLIAKPKYKIGDAVYAFTKEGLQPFTIQKILIRILKDSVDIDYALTPWDAFTPWGDLYSEAQIIPSYKKAKKRLAENADQLILLLD